MSIATWSPLEPAVPADGAPGAGLRAERWARASSGVALLLAALYGLAGSPLQPWPPAAWPAHELNGMLAVALGLAGACGVACEAGRPALLLRRLTIVALLVAAALVLAGVAQPVPGAAGPRLGPLSGSALALALVVLAASLWPLRAPLGHGWAVAAQLMLVLLWAVCVAALGTLLPARLLLDWLPLDAGLSWPASCVLALLALAATVRVYHQPGLRAFFADREDRRIFTSYLAMLFGAVGVAAMLVAGVLTVKVVQAAEPMLQLDAAHQAQALDGLIARVAQAADRAGASLLAEGAAMPEPAQLAERLRELRRQLEVHGLVALRLQAPGRAPITEGSLQDETEPRLALPTSGGVALLASQGLVLQVRYTPARLPETLLTVQVRPFELEAQLLSTKLLGARAEVLLCADAVTQAHCLSRERPAGLKMPLPPLAGGQLWPIQRAWRGQAGVVLVRDPSHAAALVAYAPVGSSGLGVAHKLLLAPLVAGLIGGVVPVLLTLLAVAGAVAGALYRRAFPPLRALRYAKAQMQATLEHLPRGVLTLDSRGRIASSNRGAQELLGLTAPALLGLPIQALVQSLVGSGGEAAPWQPQPGTGEALLLTASGARIPVEILVEGFEFERRPRSVLIVRDLRREIARRAELERWERIFLHADWGVAASSDDGQRLEQMNPAFARMHGFSVEELRQRPVLDVFAPQSRAELPRELGRLLETGHHRFESWHQRRDGSVFPVLVDVTLVLGAEGRSFRVVNVQDMTEQKRAEAAMVAAKTFFESLFQSAALGIVVLDAAGRFVRVNRALCELLCRDEPDLLALGLADVGEPDMLAGDLATLENLRNGAPGKVEFERRWRRGDGQAVWVLLVVSLMRLPCEEQPQFVVQVLDIDRNRRFQQALLASEARLLNAQRLARLADWEWDPARDEVWVSEPGRRMLNLPAGHPGLLVGSQWLARVHPEDRPAVERAARAALQGLQPLKVDYRLQLERGGERFLHQQGERGAGEPRRLVGILQDITERKKVETELLQSRRRLRELSAKQEELIENERRHIAREVHDELGQALTALKMELSMLSRRFGAADAALAAQAGHMSAMVDGTLDVVRHVASNLRPSALDFGLVAAVEWLAEDFSLRWEIACEVHLEGRDAKLDDIPATALFRIVQESLTNVARHARAQRVDIRIVSRADVLRLSVHDDGVGFDPAAAQERGGHFGLLGMRERALAIGARLRVDSHPGGGTTVAVELRLNDNPEPTA